MPKYSIVIPTYNHLEDCLKPCIESIIQHTDLQDVEIIVVANGCDEKTREYVELGVGRHLIHYFNLVWFDEAIGFTKAANEGIKAAIGEYVVILNNDTVILGNNWLEMLEKPFKEDFSVGITGAAKNYHEPTKHDFLLFFCVMLSRKTINHIGLLDEVFNPGYGEDIDYCFKVRRKGLRVVQVPNDVNLSKLREPSEHTLQFPIWHKSSQTVHSVPKWTEIVERNEKILMDRYTKLDNYYAYDSFDNLPANEITPAIDRITSQLKENGLVHFKLNDRTTAVLAKGGFIHGLFPGKENMDKLADNIPKYDLIDIKGYVLSRGSKGIAQFGGTWEGGYATQQDPDEISSFLLDNWRKKIKNYLEIGAAEGGVTRLLCDIANVENVTHIDLGWGDMNHPYTYRQGIENLQNTGKIDIFRGDSTSKQAEEFLGDRKFDMIFIDGDHSYEGALKDTQLAMRHAEDGCLFVYHDHHAVQDVGRLFLELQMHKFQELSFVKEYSSDNPVTRKGISVFKYSKYPFVSAKTEVIRGEFVKRDNPKISIVIPTYNHLEDALKPCIESIEKYTTMDEVEIIVVANGCTDGTHKYIANNKNIHWITWSEPLGFIKACNIGIKEAKGEFIVLLNNDTELLEQEKDTWLKMLSIPFMDEKVGITGPYKDWRFLWDNDRLIFRTEYMVFYCAMIRKEVFDRVGLLDEAFGAGYQEDIDFCIRAKEAGYKIVQVPDDMIDELNITKEFLVDYKGRTSDFPLYHKDNLTFKDIAIRDNTPILSKKWSKTPKYSIVIPTYNHLEDLLHPCLKSIAQYTDLEQVEVIVVANGCTDQTREYVHALGHPFKLLWIDEQVGYIKATNAGIKQAMGDYIVLLNNDVEIKGKDWLELLEKPFTTIGTLPIGITGPVKAHRDDVNRNYILFWCAMISRDVINDIGLLDEQFGLGYHEDVDFCMRAEDMLYGLVQVDNVPIYHKGGGTFASIYGNSPERLDKHKQQLYNKWSNANDAKRGFNFTITELPQGWFGEGDKMYHKELIKTIPEGGRMAEIGVWKGLSLCSAAELIRDKNISVLAVDTFQGSPWEGKEGATVPDDTNLQIEFESNIKIFGIKNNVYTCPLDSLEAAKTIEDKSLDLVFIDGDHRYEAVLADIKAWLPKVKDTGYISGHDYLWGEEVRAAVDSIFGKERVYHSGNIWYIIPENKNYANCDYNSPSQIKNDAEYGKEYAGALIEDLKMNSPIVSNFTRKVYDCFTFFNELEILQVRLEELWDVVDKFVIVESTFTHQGTPKPLYFNKNMDRFKQYMRKIEHVIVYDFPNCVTTWDREHYQRNQIIQGLKDAQPNDVIILSDCDEILSENTVRNYKIEMGVCAVEMPLFYYKLDWKIEERWYKPRIFPFSAIGDKSLQFFRGDGDYIYNTVIPNGGWHFSFMGDKESIRAKIQSYAHDEFNSYAFTNDQNIEEAIEQGRDVFKRNLHFSRVPIDDSYPKYVRDNFEYFQNIGLLSKKKSDRNYKIFDCFSFFNELDLLEIRLNELDPYVDFFVISEMRYTHSGIPKPLYFINNKERFSKFLHKIKHVVPPDIETSDPWVREHHQRDYMVHMLDQRPEDWVIVSDLDEIPRGGKIQEYNGKGVRWFEQNQYSYYLNYNVGISPIYPGTFSRITNWGYIERNNLTLTGLRYLVLQEEDGIRDGGWHFSWMGGANKIVEKLDSFAHQEFNKPENKDVSRIQALIDGGSEHLGRPGVGETTPVEIDSTFPKYIQDNVEHFKEITMIGQISNDRVAVVMPYYNDKAFITKSVGAILGQTFKNWHLFIVDDGSDLEQSAVRILASHPQITIIYEKNAGPAAARNSAIDRLSWCHMGLHNGFKSYLYGEFTHVAFCDSDDIWERNYLQSQLRAIGNADVVYCSVNHKFENGEVAIPYGIPDPPEYPGREVMLSSPFIFISSVLMKIKCLEIGNFEPALDSIEDWDYWLRLDEAGFTFVKNNQKLLTYTVKEGMASKRTAEKDKLFKERHYGQLTII